MADAVKVGTILGIATIVMFHAASIVRVNLFLDAIRHRGDWQNLVARYNQSGFRSLRAYANYEHATMTPMVIALGVIAGSISGVLGGLVKHGTRDATSPLRQDRSSASARKRSLRASARPARH